MKKYYESPYANKFYRVYKGRNFIKQVTKTAERTEDKNVMNVLNKSKFCEQKLPQRSLHDYSHDQMRKKYQFYSLFQKVEEEWTLTNSFCEISMITLTHKI